MKQLVLDIGIRNQPQLDQIDAQANPVLVDRLRALVVGLASKNQDFKTPAIYVWGVAGCGKTHLLRALAGTLDQQGQAIGWLDAQGEQTSAWDARWCAGLLDDVDDYQPGLQETAFQWFIDAQTHQKPIVATGRRPPADLPLREDLRSRLAWGEVFAMHPPGDERRREILQTQATARGLKLSTEVSDYLLTRFSRDLGHLVGLLDQLDRYAMQRQRPITIPLVKAMMDEAED